MSNVAHQLLLVVSLGLLAAGAGRAAAQLTDRGLERAVAAAAIAATVAGLEALGLGLAGLGADPLALSLLTAAAWAAARVWLPAPEPGYGAQIGAWWTSLTPRTRVVLGAVGGAGLAWTLWLLRVPALGYDTVNYHLPEAVIWAQDGDPGSVIPGVLSGVTYLPLMSEVLLTWQVGISRSLAPVSLQAPASMLLMAGAGWLGLRELGVSRAATAVAVAVLCATPTVTHYQMNGAYNDLPALAWLVATAALATASRRNVALLAPTLLAGALAVGTKTTTLPLTALLVALAVWPHRHRLRPVARPLAAATAAALVIGGVWYLRDLLEHGSPFWPDVTLPWGDPSPVNSPSFLERPRATIDRFGDDYLRLFAGALITFAGALLVPLTTRRRTVWIAAGVTAASLLLWLNAPATGAAESGSAVGTVSTLRYALPAVAAAVATLSLASREPGWPARLAAAVLGAALAVNVVQTWRLGFPSVPGAWVPASGAALGAIAAVGLSELAARVRTVPPWAVATGVALTGALAAATLAVGASGYVERHIGANARTVYPYTAMIRWLVTDPRYRAGDDVVAMSPVPNGVVVGDRLEHRFEEIPRDEPCRRVRERLGRQWVLVNFIGIARGVSADRCLARVPPSLEGPGFRAYRPRAAP